MIGGTNGRVLHVDLTAGSTHIEHPDDDFYRLLVGGRAVVAFLLLREVQPGTRPLSPENVLIFAPGVMQGSNFPGAGRHGIGGKSPLTGALGSSEVGGWWGHEFKRSGFDVLVIRGQAKSPTYLWIRDGQVELRSAEHLWGMTTAPTQIAIRNELRDQHARIAQIGPAGENLVRYAAVMHDVNRAAGRNGLGALMGSKRLKAVVVRGTRKVPVADRARVAAIARWFGENYREKMGWATAGIGRGTQDSLTGLAYRGGLPTRNFGEPVFEHANLLSGERNYEMFYKGRDTCQGCPVNCKQVFENDVENPNQRLDPIYGGAEYEGMAALGSCCGVDDNLSVLKANELCNAYGLDTISTGMTIAFVMECFENGIITTQDTDGLAYRWGDPVVLLRSIEKIARREGFGKVMAEGVARMSHRLGRASDPFNLTVKGQELPMHEPRLKHAMGVGYAVAPVGADHMMNMHDTLFAVDGASLQRVNNVLSDAVGPLSPNVLNEDKLRVFHHELNWKHFQDCALICHFYCYDYDQLAEAVSGVTGVEYGVTEVLDIGARAQTLARLFNLREGFTAADDRLPERVMRAFDRGPLAGIEITKEAFAWARSRYYELLGWSSTSGEPTAECLQTLEIDRLLS
jgi:aldehyde:ferredoxin oxidoreductase